MLKQGVLCTPSPRNEGTAMRRTATGLALALLALATLAAQEKTAPKDPPSDPAASSGGEVSPIPLREVTAADQKRRDAEAVVRKALQKRVDAAFVDTPLSEVAKYLGERAGTEILIDETSLMEEGVATDQPISRELSQMTLGQILHRILRPHGLTWVIRNEKLTIITQVKADEKLATRTWNVGRIVAALTAEKKRADEEATTSGEPPTSDARGSAALREIIEAGTGGGFSADAPGGTLALSGDLLTVRHPQSTLEEIDGLLQLLEEFLGGKLNHGSAEFFPAWSPAADDLYIREILAKTIPDLSFVDTPLSEVASNISDRMKITIILDETALMEEGVATDQPITLKLGAVTCDSALNLMLDPHGLTTIVDRGCLVITTQVKADEILGTVLYDVRDLTDGGFRPQALRDLITEASGPGMSSGSGRLETVPRGALIVRATQKTQREIALLLSDIRATRTAAKPTTEKAAADGIGPPAGKPAAAEPISPDAVETRFYHFARRGVAAELKTSVPTFVAPRTWSAMGGVGAAESVGDTLVVRQTRAVHEQIRRFLAELKAAEAQPPK
jgi:hypothetical protein